MAVKIPFLNTRIENDLLTTLLLTPVWWLLGFNIFVYQAVVYLAFLRMMARLTAEQRSLRIPIPALWFGLFLVSYLVSILINFSNHPPQRIFSSLNHFLVFVMGFFLVVILPHLDTQRILRNLFRISWFLSQLTGILAICFLILWLVGYKDLAFPSLAGWLFPRLSDFPFFYLFSTIRITETDWLFFKLPRLSIYSTVSTATGGFMLITLPLGLAYCRLTKKSPWVYYGGVGISLVALIFSLSRTAVCAFLSAFVFVWFLERRNKFLMSWLLLLLVFFGSGKIYDWGTRLLNLRYESTVGRFTLYSEALQIVREENLLMGIGVRPREEFTMMAVGSHSTYVGLLLISGLLGLLLFVLFQGSTWMSWLRQGREIQDEDQRVVWRYLGWSFLGATLWLLTDTLDTLPFIAYLYFLTAGSILAFEIFLKKNRESRLSS